MLRGARRRWFEAVEVVCSQGAERRCAQVQGGVREGCGWLGGADGVTHSNGSFPVRPSPIMIIRATQKKRMSCPVSRTVK